MNEQREKLIKLLAGCKDRKRLIPAYAIKNLADHLLANGVVVLPCKVGDTVYSISNKICKAKTRYLNTCYDCDGAEFWNNCFRANDAPFSIEFEYDMIDEIGKTIFLTIEEAEEALAKRKGGDE